MMDLPVWLLFSYETRMIEKYKQEAMALDGGGGEKDPSAGKVSLPGLADELGMSGTGMPAGEMDRLVAEQRRKNLGG